MSKEKNSKKLSVRLHGEPLGILEQKTNGKMAFSYLSEAKKILSLSMPFREEPYDYLICEAFFGGLLPESESAKKALGKQYGISHNNSFSLLKAIGYDCAGAVSFHELESPVITQSAFKLEGQIIDPDILYSHIKTLPKKPLFSGFEDLRLSLAGVQDKAAVCLINNQIALPMHGCPTTYILKAENAHFEGIVENEFLCLSLAKDLGLIVPEVEIRQVKDLAYLLIQRYDREINNNLIERIHQEDFCQALGINSARKYQNEGGPNLKHCFDLLNQTAQPAMHRLSLLNIIIFNFLINNMDAHGKNFSLLHTPVTKNTTAIQLAPFYDLLCTRYFPDLTSNMAMKIGGEYKADKINVKNWEKFCEDINYPLPALKKLIQQQGEKLLGIINSKINLYSEPLSNKKSRETIQIIGKLITQNIQWRLELFH